MLLNHPIRSTSMMRALPMIALLACACDPTVSGKNDVLRFRYDADDNVLPAAFSTPIGTGLAARVEVFVDADGNGGATETAAPVIDASSTMAAVATVVATSGNVVTIQAKSPGRTEIRVQTARGEDAFDLSVVDVAKVDVSHPGVLVSDEPPSKGIAGGTARFILALKDAGDQQVVGFGRFDIAVAPSGAATVQDSEAFGFVPVRFAVEGAATLTGKGDQPLDLEIVADASVTAIELAGAGAVSSLAVDGELAAVLRGRTASGEKVVGVASLATVTSSDTAVCTITPNFGLGEGAYLIKARSPGTCRVEATLGARAVRHDLTVATP